MKITSSKNETENKGFFVTLFALFAGSGAT